MKTSVERLFFFINPGFERWKVGTLILLSESNFLDSFFLTAVN